MDKSQNKETGQFYFILSNGVFDSDTAFNKRLLSELIPITHDDGSKNIYLSIQYLC